MTTSPADYWDSIYPIGKDPAGVTVFWLVLGAVGLLLCASLLRASPRRR